MKKFTKEQIGKVAELTDYNHHSRNLVYISEISENLELQKQFQALFDLHHYFGGMTPELMKLRKDLFADLEIFLTKEFENSSELLEQL